MTHLADHVDNVMRERNAAWAELRAIRAAIGAHPEESTLDEVRRVVAQLNLLAELANYLQRNYDQDLWDATTRGLFDAVNARGRRPGA